MRYTMLFCCLVVAAILLCSCGKRQSDAGPTAQEVSLCESVGIGAATCATIKNDARADLQPLQQLDAEGREGKAVGIQFAVQYDKADVVLRNLRTKLQGDGCLAFLAQQNFGFDKKPDRIGVIKADDQYDIVRIRQTSAGNYDIDNAAVIAKLKGWEKVCSFEIVGADQDWVALSFITLPSNLKSFTDDVYKFCPDIVDQGSGSVAELADEIRNTKSVTLWWD